MSDIKALFNTVRLVDQEYDPLITSVDLATI